MKEFQEGDATSGAFSFEDGEDGKIYFGFPYQSVYGSMPVVGNDKMKPSNICNVCVRFDRSFMPKLKALSNGVEDQIFPPMGHDRSQPFSGVVRQMYPGGWERDVLIEITHCEPTPCRILSVYAEAK